MPTAPQYGIPKVAEAGLPNARLSATPTADTFGASIGNAVAKTGTQMYGEIVHQANIMRVEDATNKARDIESELTFGRKDGDPGFLSERGVNALERESGQPLSAEYLGKFDERVKAIGQDLTQQQQQMFRSQASTIRRSMQSRANTHEYTQQEAHYDGIDNGAMAGEANRAALGYNNDEEIFLSRARYGQAAERFADRKGLSGAQRDTFVAGKVSDFHNSIIGVALSNNDLNRAQKYFDANKKEIDFKDHIAIQSNIRTTTGRVEVEARDAIGHGVTQAENRIATNPTIYRTERDAMAAVISNLPGVSTTLRLKMNEDMDSRLRRAAVLGMAEIDPVGTLAMLKGKATPDAVPSAAGRFESVVQGVLKREGGFVASDGAGGAPANFGINQAANPDIYVKNLTKNKAAAIYKARYWDAINADTLPSTTAIVAMDAAVNQGVPYAQNLLKKTGGDPAAMLAQRESDYRDLAKQPKHAQFLQQWLNRMGEVRAEVAANPVTQEPKTLPKTGDRFIDDMPLAERFALLRQVQAQGRELQQIEKHRMNAKLQDFESMAKTGAELPMTAIPSEIELRRAYGEADGVRMYQNQVAPLVQLVSEPSSATGATK